MEPPVHQPEMVLIQLWKGLAEEKRFEAWNMKTSAVESPSGHMRLTGSGCSTTQEVPGPTGFKITSDWERDVEIMPFAGRILFRRLCTQSSTGLAQAAGVLLAPEVTTDTNES